MTVESSKNKAGPFLVAGPSGTFPRDFLLIDEDHLRVIRVRDEVETDLSVGISHTGVGTADGTVTITAGIETGDQIYLLRSVPKLQRSDYSAQGRVRADQVESDLDLLEMQVQDLAEAQARGLTIPLSSSASAPAVVQAALEAPRHAAEVKASAASAALYDGPWLDTVAALLADTTLFYGIGASGVTAGDIIRTRAEGFAYRVIADGDADYDIATAGGVRLYLLPTAAGHYNFAGMAPAADSVTDDYPKLKRLLDRPAVGSGFYQSVVAIFFPMGAQYFIGQAIDLKKSVRLFGDGAGVTWDAAPRLAVAYTLLPSLSDSGRGWGWVSTVFLFPTDLPPALSVAWTLQHELAFYLIYAALFFTGGLRLGLLVWVSWITVVNRAGFAGG